MEVPNRHFGSDDKSQMYDLRKQKSMQIKNSNEANRKLEFVKRSRNRLAEIDIASQEEKSKTQLEYELPMHVSI